MGLAHSNSDLYSNAHLVMPDADPEPDDAEDVVFEAPKAERVPIS